MHALLALLPQLARGLLDLGLDALADETVLGLELEALLGVVDQRKASRAAATVLSAHAEHGNLLRRSLVHLTEFVAELSLRDVGTRGVDHVKHHLLALEQTVGEELASPQGDRRVGVLVSDHATHHCRVDREGSARGLFHTAQLHVNNYINT